MKPVKGNACFRQACFPAMANHDRRTDHVFRPKERDMQTQVTEIAADTYRISTFHHEYGLQFNQFLILDEAPFLMHTGFRKMFQSTLDGVSRVMDPARLRWIGFSHFEPDECGALNQWLSIAPQAQVLGGFVGNTVMLNDFADRPGRMLADNEILSLGRHHVRFLATPHVPHGWDAGMYFDETERTLFSSDLFFQPGNPQPMTESDIVGPASTAIQLSLQGPLAHDMPYTPYTNSTLQRLAGLTPETLAVMHGSSYRGDGGKALTELAGVLQKHLGGAAPG
jgi:flavorubredoxin